MKRVTTRLFAPGGSQVGVALGVALVCFVVYLSTLAPTVHWGDSAELATVAARLGISHPPGYPLYTLLGKFFVLMIPFGDAAYRVNLMSAVFASLGMGSFYLLAFTFAGRVIPALLATMTIAFSADVWGSAVVAEVYSLQVFLMLASMLALMRWSKSGDVRWLYALGAVVGLALAHHSMTILLLPGLAFGVVVLGPWRSLKAHQVAIGSGLVLSGLLLYLYLPLRYMQEPALDVARLSGANLGTLSGMVEFLSGRVFQGRLDFTGVSAMWLQMGSIVSSMGAHLLVVGGVFVVVGALRQLRRRGREFLFVALIWLPSLLFLSAYKVDDISQFVVMALVPLGVWLAEGFAFVLVDMGRWLEGALSKEVGRSTGWLLSAAPAILLALIPVALVVVNYSDVDLSGDRTASRYGRENLEALPQGSVLWTQWPNNVFWYSQMVEGVRPDVEVVDFRYEIHRALGSYDSRALEQEQGGASNARIALEALSRYSNRPLYLSVYLPLLATRWSMEQYGDLYRLLDKGIPQVGDLEVGEKEVSLPVFGGTIRLVGVGLEPRSVLPGGFVRVSLSWRVIGMPATANYNSFTLLDSQGRMVQYFAMEQGHGLMPSSEWPTGKVVSEYYDLLIPYYAAPGRYFLDLRVGDGSRFLSAVAGTSSERFESVRLGEIQVSESTGGGR